jgi:hypothetical protein
MFEEKGLSSSRPFKIFISLLDKWEIGGPVTEVLILDSLKAVKRNIANGDADDVGSHIPLVMCHVLMDAYI